MCPHGCCPPSLTAAEVAAEALAELVAKANEVTSSEAKQRPLASTYLEAAKHIIFRQLMDKKVFKPFNEFDKELMGKIAPKAESQCEAAYLKVAIDMLCWKAARESAEHRPSNVIRAEILKKTAAWAIEMKSVVWDEAPYVPGQVQKMEGRIAALLRPTRGSLKEELDKVEGRVVLMVMKRQLMHVQLPWGLYRCGKHAVLLYTGRDSADGLVRHLRPHKERIESAVLYYADKGPFSNMDLIAELVSCVRADAPVIVMNCRCTSGHSYGPSVVARATGRTDILFWRRARHDMENVMCGQLAHFAKHGRLSSVETFRRSDFADY